MPFYRAALIFPMDTALPKDEISIHPCFSGTDPDALAAALQTNLNAFATTAGKPYTIKIYDAAKAPPSYPLATRTNPGNPPTSGCPREVSLCLSFYSTYNRPRYRGRLYLPGSWLTSSPSVRPSGTQMSGVMAFATEVLTKTLPQATNWVVYSKLAGTGYGVSDYWCDDEWDTQRSRGLKATTRLKAKV